MRNKQKGSTVAVLLVIIALLVIGGGVYVYNNKKVEVPVYSTDTTNQVQQTNAQNTQASPQVVSVSISISNMNEPVFSLLNGMTILGQKYLYIRNGDSVVIGTVDPASGNMGDSCGDTVQATLEVANPKVEAGRTTFHGDSTVTVDVIKVISHDNPKRTCAN